MKKILGLALAGALSVAALPAVAADYPLKAPPPPIWTWTGFYVGINAGAGWIHTRQDASPVPGTTGDIQGSGGVIGGTLGWNWQNGPWVFGIEGDWDWTNLRANGGACVPACNTNVNWLATVRGRFGHAMGPLLFFVTGGVAFADTSYNQVGNFNYSDTQTGWTVGAGIEGALGGGWSLKADYLYVDLGNSTTSPLAFAPGNVTHAAYLRAHLLRGGVNYKF